MRRIAVVIGISAFLGGAAWLWRQGLPGGSPVPAAPLPGAGAGAFCNEHGVPEAECRICNPPGADACKSDKVRIRFASPEVAEAVGVATEEVKAGRLAETVTAHGRVAFDATRTARVSSRIPGVLREVLKDLGQDVEAGEILFTVDSVELGEAQAEFLQAASAADLAERNAGRERALFERSATSQKELLAAEAEQQSAQARLSRASDRLGNLGLSGEAVTALRKGRRISSRLAVASPLAGTVVERAGAVGEAVDAARPVLAVTDLSRVWVMLDLFEKEIGRVKVGQGAVFTADAYPDRPFKGRVSWISAAVDPESRTLSARMEVEDPGRLLKANLFGKAEITVREEPEALAVPKAAVQWEGCHSIVFVPVGEGQYQTRQVALGWAGDGVYEVIAGLLPGERVVTTGSFLMKTEVLKGSIGAG